MSTIGPAASTAASGLFNMLRSLGGAVGTAALATLIIKREQLHSNIIGQSVTGVSAGDQSVLTRMQLFFQAHGVPDPVRSYHQAEVLHGNLVARQALILAFSDAFQVMALVLLTAALAASLTRARPAAAR